MRIRQARCCRSDSSADAFQYHIAQLSVAIVVVSCRTCSVWLRPCILFVFVCPRNRAVYRVANYVGKYVLRTYVVINYVCTYRVFLFIVSPSNAGLSHRKPASAGTYRGNCRARDSDKRNELYLSPWVCTCVSTCK